MRDSIKQDAKRRLARISGQVSGLSNMVEEGRYCVDVLTQVAALRAALDQFGVLMLTTHLEDCVYGGEADSHGHYQNMSEAERVEEIRTTLNRFLK